MKIVRVFLGLLVILFLGNNRKALPSYNPFDNLFDISRDKLEEDSCKMIGGMCGWFNLTKKIDNLEIYYQFFALEEEVVAKGFSLALDTININGIQFSEKNKIEDLLTITLIDIELIKRKIKPYNVVLEEVIETVNEYGDLEITIAFRIPSNELIIGLVNLDFEYYEKGFLIKSLGVYRSRKIFKKDTISGEIEITEEMELI